jgi:hypothetical protein
LIVSDVLFYSLFCDGSFFLAISLPLPPLSLLISPFSPRRPPPLSLNLSSLSVFSLLPSPSSFSLSPSPYPPSFLLSSLSPLLTIPPLLSIFPLLSLIPSPPSLPSTVNPSRWLVCLCLWHLMMISSQTKTSNRHTRTHTIITHTLTRHHTLAVTTHTQTSQY